MKRFALPLGLAAFALACSDNATSPDRHAALKLTDPTVVAALGDKPPPPVDAAIAVTITSTPATAIFTGVFFNNGSINDDGGSVIETFDGTAWLRFDNNKQPNLGFFSGKATANARFMVHDAFPPTGSGTLTVGGVDYKIDQVISFVRFAACGLPEGPPSPCAQIEFTVTDPDGNPHGGHLVAFEKSECLSDSGEGLFYDFRNCPPPDIGS